MDYFRIFNFFIKEIPVITFSKSKCFAARLDREFTSAAEPAKVYFISTLILAVEFVAPSTLNYIIFTVTAKPANTVFMSRSKQKVQ